MSIVVKVTEGVVDVGLMVLWISRHVERMYLYIVPLFGTIRAAPTMITMQYRHTQPL